MNPTTTTTITVSGMTCGHCIAAVTEELTGIDGVTDVTVDLASGAVSISSDGPVDRVLIANAIDEAGYEVVA